MLLPVMLLSALSFASIDFDSVESKIKDLETYTALIDLIEKEIAYTDSEGNKISYTVEREIGYEFQQERFAFITEEYGQYFHLSLVKHNDKLVFCLLSQGKKMRNIIFNKIEIEKYTNYFNKTFNTTKTIKDFKKEIDSIWIFTTGCGFSVEPSREWKKIERYIDTQRVDKVRDFLYSMNIESQAYGLIGMLKLMKQGVKLSEKDVEAINYLKEQNSNIYTCMGCILGEIIGLKQLAEYWEN